MTDKIQWSDLIAKALEKLGGEAHLQDVYTEVLRTADGKAKLNAIKVRSKGKDPKNFKATIRSVIQKDKRFARAGQRGFWKLTEWPPGSGTAPETGWKPKTAMDKRVKEVLQDGSKPFNESEEKNPVGEEEE